MREVVVIGGGASGMMAAIAAARCGAKVTLIEKNTQAGKKLLMTGNGRCNFTNQDQRLMHYRSQHQKLVEPVLKAFSMEDTVTFFKELGIVVKDRKGYLYPASNQAASVVKVLQLELRRLLVKEAYHTEVLSVKKQKEGFLVETEGWKYKADAVILACGSMAAPKTGSTGDGYRFARQLGHTVGKVLPALTGVYVKEKDAEKLAGVRMEAKVTLLIDGKNHAEDEGEVQFASYGLSGIPIFQISRYAAWALEDGKKCEICLDFLKEHTFEDVREILEKQKKYTQTRRGVDCLLGIFPEKLSQVLLLRAKISAKKIRKDWTEEEIERLLIQIKRMGFFITRCRGYEQAQVCTGGVPLTEIKGTTMESLKSSGLYLTGELLDVDGACGGYNLQWAWSSGYLAGVHAAKEE